MELVRPFFLQSIETLRRQNPDLRGQLRSAKMSTEEAKVDIKKSCSPAGLAVAAYGTGPWNSGLTSVYMQSMEGASPTYSFIVAFIEPKPMRDVFVSMRQFLAILLGGSYSALLLHPLQSVRFTICFFVTNVADP
jgi:hypothetical protein